jgi:uncharacterized repeat protein (TIGR01451 family)
VHHLHRSYRVLLWAIVMSALLLVAWQDASPLSITVACSPEVTSSGELLTCTFTVSNDGDRDLDDVVARVPLPEGTAFERASAPSEGWTISEPSADREVVYRAQAPLSPIEPGKLVLVMRVEAASGTAILLTGYTASAAQLASPIEGAPITVWVAVTPTPAAEATATPSPEPTATPQPTPSPTATAQPSPTASPSPTVRPSPTASPTTTPTPTITVVAGELPTLPPPTPTPNLSSEQVRIGTVTVSIFAGLVLAVAIASIVWVVRSSQSREPDEEE